MCIIYDVLRVSRDLYVCHVICVVKRRRCDESELNDDKSRDHLDVNTEKSHSTGDRRCHHHHHHHHHHHSRAILAAAPVAVSAVVVVVVVVVVTVVVVVVVT